MTMKMLMQYGTTQHNIKNLIYYENTMFFWPLIWWLAALLAIIFLVSALVKVKPNEKAVKERLSKYQSTLWPWWHLLIPFIDSIQKVDMRERVINTSPQEMITQDNAVVTVDAVVFAQIFDPVKAVYEIQDAFYAISALSGTELRAIIWTMTLDAVLWERAEINIKVQTELAEETAKRWVSINKIEIQHIDPPRELMDAMNQQKIAQQQKRAAILEAEWAKEAAIRAAEWEKEAAIRAAEWERESQIRRAEWFREKQMLEAQWQADAIIQLATAKAKALELESLAAVEYFKDTAITQEQLRVVEKALSNNSKRILWNDITSLLHDIGSKIPKVS